MRSNETIGFFFWNERKLSPLNISIVPPLLTSPSSPWGLSGTMALYSGCFSVYVALHLVLIAFTKFTYANAGGGGSSVLSLLQPYDFLYYSGVRAYFGEEWTKAAELLEKSIVTKESLFRVRGKCHDECMTAGREALDKLGELLKISDMVCFLVEMQSDPVPVIVIVCVAELPNMMNDWNDSNIAVVVAF